MLDAPAAITRRMLEVDGHCRLQVDDDPNTPNSRRFYTSGKRWLSPKTWS